MNKLFLSIFGSFMLGKITSLTVKTHKGSIQEDSLSGVLNSANEVLDFLHINSIQAYNLIDLGKGFEGTSHILNYLITYTPVFFILLMSFGIIKVLVKKIRAKRVKIVSEKKSNDFFKNQNEKVIKEVKKEKKIKAKKEKEKEGFNPDRPNFLLRLVLGKDYSEFK